jgi:hypothetical protein
VGGGLGLVQSKQNTYTPGQSRVLNSYTQSAFILSPLSQEKKKEKKKIEILMMERGEEK